jgi:hypothetical protein
MSNKYQQHSSNQPHPNMALNALNPPQMLSKKPIFSKPQIQSFNFENIQTAEDGTITKSLDFGSSSKSRSTNDTALNQNEPIENGHFSDKTTQRIVDVLDFSEIFSEGKEACESNIQSKTSPITKRKCFGSSRCKTQEINALNEHHTNSPKLAKSDVGTVFLRISKRKHSKSLTDHNQQRKLKQSIDKGFLKIDFDSRQFSLYDKSATESND